VSQDNANVPTKAMFTHTSMAPSSRSTRSAAAVTAS
jgi:hypothetical protein